MPSSKHQRLLVGISFAILVCIASFLFWEWEFVTAVPRPGEEGPDQMERYFRQTGGPVAVDCGRVAIREDPTAATDCALKAFTAKQPFFVRYELQGIDSEVAAGLVSDASGRVYGVVYDSWGFSTEGLSRDSILSADHHLITTQCPAPTRLSRRATGRLTCFPPGPQSDSNLMSQENGPY